MKEYLVTGENFDEVWLIYPTNHSLKKSKDTKKRFKHISKSKNALMTVTKLILNILGSKKIKKDICHMFLKNI